MTVARPHRSGIQKGAHVQGWLVSVLLHGTVALIAIILVTQVQLSPQDEAFKWNVAIVAPTAPIQPTASPPSRTIAPSAPPISGSPAQQPTPTEPLPPPQPLGQRTTPSAADRTTVTPLPTEPPAATSPEPPPPSRQATQTTQPAEPVRHEAVVPRAPEAPPIQKPVEESTTVPAISETHTAPSTLQSAVPIQTPHSDATSTETATSQTAAIAQTPANAPTKRDYGWLSETILRRVEELKRYPASARVDRAEGRVVVKAVINEDGSIGEMEVFQSSGHPNLDKAAMETMRQAAPFHLPRPLGQPRMTIKIPMSYRMDP